MLLDEKTKETNTPGSGLCLHSELLVCDEVDPSVFHGHTHRHSIQIREGICNMRSFNVYIIHVHTRAATATQRVCKYIRPYCIYRINLFRNTVTATTPCTLPTLHGNR